MSRVPWATADPERAVEEGLYYEEFEEGRAFRTGTRLLTAADIDTFAEVSGDRNPLHEEGEYAAASVFGGRVAHGVLGLAVATGLLNGLGLTRGTLVAFVGLSWDFVRPLYPGTEVGVALEVLSRRSTSDGESGLVVLGAELRSGTEVLQRGELKLLVRRRT